MLDLLERLYGGAHADSLATDISALTLERLLQAAADDGLVFDDSLVAQVVAALRAGKHIFSTGPPGTGKTSLAQAAARQPPASASAMASRSPPGRLTGPRWTPSAAIGLRARTRRVLNSVQGRF